MSRALIPYNRETLARTVATLREEVEEQNARGENGLVVTFSFRATSMPPDVWLFGRAVAVCDDTALLGLQIFEGDCAGHWLDMPSRSFQFANVTAHTQSPASHYEHLLDGMVELTATVAETLITSATEAVADINATQRQALQNQDAALRRLDERITQEQRRLDEERRIVRQERLDNDERRDRINGEIIQERNALQQLKDTLERQQQNLNEQQANWERASHLERKELAANLKKDRAAAAEATAKAAEVEAAALAHLRQLETDEAAIRKEKKALEERESASQKHYRDLIAELQSEKLQLSANRREVAQARGHVSAQRRAVARRDAELLTQQHQLSEAENRWADERRLMHDQMQQQKSRLAQLEDMISQRASDGLKYQQRRPRYEEDEEDETVVAATDIEDENS